jgi:hypothetical protein
MDDGKRSSVAILPAPGGAVSDCTGNEKSGNSSPARLRGTWWSRNMKTCEYCQRANHNNAVRCVNCGRAFPPPLAGASNHGSLSAPVIVGRGTAWVVLAAALSGWLLLIIENSRRTALQSHYSQLQSTTAALQEEAAELKRQLGEGDANDVKLRGRLSILQGDYRKLEERLSAAAQKNQVLENQLEALSAQAPSRQAPTFQVSQSLKPMELLPPIQPQPYLAPGPADVRLANGTAIQAFSGRGNGTLQVVNLLPADAIIKLVSNNGNRCLAQFYVRAGEAYQCPGIPDGSYTVYHATGYDYDAQSKDFKRGREAKRCDSPFDFTTALNGNTLSTTRSTFTLGVPYGNTSSSRISGEEFDRYRVPR